jgi:hypothetical protein
MGTEKFFAASACTAGEFTKPSRSMKLIRDEPST